MKKKKIKKKSSIAVRAAVLLFWLALWQVTADLIHNKILLAGPVEVLMRLTEELQSASFYQSAAGTLLRILAGFFTGFLAGILFGSLAYRFSFVNMLLEPAVMVMKSIPVAAFVVLVLIWIGSKHLAIPISFLVVFPHVYISMRTGLGQTDKGMLEMAECFRMRPWNRIWYLYRPAAAPYLLSAAKVTIGMSFKSGIAAEVIGIPDHSIGQGLYLSKIYLDTTGVLSWTVVVLILSALCEKVILFFLKRFLGCRIRPLYGRRKMGTLSLELPAMQKKYESGTVVTTPPLALTEGGRMGIMGASGCGKTTWLRMISKLSEVHPACVFQEDRLCEICSAVDNVRITCMKAYQGEIVPALLKLLPKEALYQPVSELSGGMKRRVSVVRACLSGGNLLLLDEPFTGLDAESREQTAAFIREYTLGRTMIFTTHQKEDLRLLSAQCCSFEDSLSGK